MESVQLENYCFSILSFGQLSKASQISFQSLIKLNPKQICVLGDKLGIDSIKTTAEKYNFANICVHYANTQDLKTAGLLKEDQKYSKFGDERFIRLTTFKWYLIKDSLTKHREFDGVFFSDLDVLWIKKPSTNYLKKLLSNGFVVLQNDSRPNADYFRYCTGIMYWKNCNKSSEVLEILFNLQLSNMARNILIPDEPTFNTWMFSSDHDHLINPFPKNEFIIGYEYFKIFNLSSKELNKIFCFHANYTVGARSKYRRLKSIDQRVIGRMPSIRIFAYEVMFKIFHKAKE